MKKINFNEYDLFVVDFDGTIADTMYMWKDICKNFILSMGKTPEEDVYKKITSKTNVEIAKYIRDNYIPEYSDEEAVKLFFDYIKSQYILQDIKKNAYNLLADINKCGKVVLYSATASDVLNVLLDKFSLREYFAEIYSGSDLGITKRDGTGYLKVIELAGGSKKPLILEDAVHAIIGASSQNLDVLAIKDFSNMNQLDIVKEYAKYIIDLDLYE